MEIATDGANSKWKERYLRTIQMSYSRHAYYSDVYPLLEAAIKTETYLLCEINMAIMKSFADKRGTYPEYIQTREKELFGIKTDLILDICETVGTNVYIAGPSGRDYLNV